MYTECVVKWNAVTLKVDLLHYILRWCPFIASTPMTRGTLHPHIDYGVAACNDRFTMWRIVRPR